MHIPVFQRYIMQRDYPDGQSWQWVFRARHHTYATAIAILSVSVRLYVTLVIHCKMVLDIDIVCTI